MKETIIDLDIDNLETLLDICKIKNKTLEYILNYIVDQYILYFNDMVKTNPEYQVKPRNRIKPEKKLMGFKEFIQSSRYQKN